MGTTRLGPLGTGQCSGEWCSSPLLPGFSGSLASHQGPELPPLLCGLLHAKQVPQAGLRDGLEPHVLVVEIEGDGLDLRIEVQQTQIG